MEKFREDSKVNIFDRQDLKQNRLPIPPPPPGAPPALVIGASKDKVGLAGSFAARVMHFSRPLVVS